MNRRKNIRLIGQKTPTDCGVCSMAMLTGLGYKKTYELMSKSGAYVEGKGLYDDHKALLALGLREGRERNKNVPKALNIVPIDFKVLWKPWEISAKFYAQQIWGRRALLSVPSLNNPGGSHMIYWHYDRIYDPSPKKTYKEFNELEPTGIIIFMESDDE